MPSLQGYPILASDKCESFAQFQHEPAQIICQGILKAFL